MSRSSDEVALAGIPPSSSQKAARSAVAEQPFRAWVFLKSFICLVVVKYRQVHFAHSLHDG